jgi:hypothetical protein
MMRHAALRQLERVLAGLFERVFSGISAGAGAGGQQGNGGIWSTIASFGLKAIGALFGGGAAAGGAGAAAAGTIGNFADGGFMQPNSWAMVGERGPELIRAGWQGATVRNHEDSQRMAGGGGQTVNNWYITTRDANSFQRRETQRQIGRNLGKLQRAA